MLVELLGAYVLEPRSALTNILMVLTGAWFMGSFAIVLLGLRERIRA